ncbi:MAG: thiamine phosphate synthase [Acetobacteraceae bacterium]|nr:thiamine phosphate synthase [Acetobacteraceae bacterium]
MDQRLLDWARAVKAVSRGQAPTLWLFTDARRLPDPRAAAARLPRGIGGVVLRHDTDPALGRALARLCRARRLALVVAGDPRLAAALGAGVHLRDGRWPGAARPPRRRGALLTSSAHDAASLRRAAAAGVNFVFLSPAFPTASHPGGASLGAVRWSRLAARSAAPVAALGGIDGDSVRRLRRAACAGAGAISALDP